MVLLSKKKSIIVLTRRNPILEHGGDVRRINVYIDSLRDDCFIDVVCLGKETTTKTYGNVRVSQIFYSKKWAFLKALQAVFLFRPLQVMILAIPEYQFKVKELCQKNEYSFGIVHLIRLIDVAKKIKSIDWHLEMTDAIAKGLTQEKVKLCSLMGIIRIYEKQFLLKEELCALQQFSKICVVSEIDKNFFNSINPHLSEKITVIPNSVSRERLIDINCSRIYSLGFIGRLDSYVNQQALVFILEKILCFIPDTPYKLKVVGSDCPKWLELRLRGISGVKLVKNVASVELEAAEFKVGVCPVEHPNGIQNKIMDYFFGGCSVVSSFACRSPFLEVDKSFGNLIHAPMFHGQSEYIKCIEECLSISENQRYAEASRAQELFQQYFGEEAVAKQVRAFCDI